MSRNPAGVPASRPVMGLADVRRHHLSVVLEYLARNGPRSRATLAQSTGLTKATISALVADLISRGLVEELQARAGRMGRPAIDVGLSGASVGAIGLQVDVDRVAACIVDMSGAIRFSQSHQGDFRDAGPDQVLGHLRRVAAEALSLAVHGDIRCAGGALAVPGLVDPTSGALFVAPNLHWLDVDLTDPGSVLDLPPTIAVTVDNEANLGALAELQHGSGRNLSSFVYLSGGVGVGAGIVINGKVLRGSHGFAGEVGHVIVEPGGRLCACGTRGCLETVVGAGRTATKRRRADGLASALRSVVHLIDPEAVVLGGTFAQEGDTLADAVADRLRHGTLGARWHACDVRVSTLGMDAALVGAATAALERVLADPTIVPIASPRRSA